MNLIKKIKKLIGEYALQPSTNSTFTPGLWGRSYDDRYENWDREGKITRPSFDEQALFVSYMGDLTPETKILVLGPTPELRDLVAGSRVFVADMSSRILEASTRYLKKAKPDGEKWLTCDWLQLPLPPGYFDVIIGDLVLNQFPPGELEEKFLRTVHTLLAPSGRFVSRFMFKEINPPLTHLQKYIAFLCNYNVFSRREKVFAIANLSLRYTCNDSTRMNNLYGAWTALEHIRRTGQLDYRGRSLVRDAIRYLKTNGMTGGRWWAAPSEKELLRQINLYFSIGARGSGKDYYSAKSLPVIQCIPRISK